MSLVGGMRQRGFAIALLCYLMIKLIVADEPTTGLDVTVAAQILAELTRLCRRRDMALLISGGGEYCDNIASDVSETELLSLQGSC
jgi:peptide/nickel transport system ATP-binding protein